MVGTGEARISPGATEFDQALIARLRSGEEAAFEELVSHYHRTLMSLAACFVADREVAEEIVQDTWVIVLQGIDRFEERSSLKTWLSRIVMNRARTRGVRDKRVVTFSALAGDESSSSEPSVDPDRFMAAGSAYPGHWSVAPSSWGESPEKRLLGQEKRQHLMAAIDALPPAQRVVITMRDVQGWDAEEVCNDLGLSETNQRVLLHRARSRVRAAVEPYMGRQSGAAC